MTLRYGIIGSGMMGQEHIRNISLLADTEVRSIVEPNDEMAAISRQIAIDHGMPEPARRQSVDDLLAANDIDAVVVVSPNDTHYNIMQSLLASDLPILLEKPSATTPEKARKLASMARSRKAPVWVAMEYRYMPPIARAIEEVQRRTIGETKMIAITEHRFPFLDKVGHWNRYSERTGGTMIEKCCHFFDLMRLVSKSEPVRIFGSGGQDVNFLEEEYDGNKSDILDNAFVIVDFENGVRASLDLCMFADGSYWQEHLSIIGDQGKAEAFVPGPSRFWPGGKERRSKVVISPRSEKAPTREELHVDETLLAAGDHHGSTYYQHLKFAELVLRSGSDPEVSLDDGAIAVEMGAAAEYSIATGELVHFSK